MNKIQIQSAFRESLEEYKEEYEKERPELVVSNFVSRLKEEFPSYFRDWMNPVLTGEPVLEPISKIEIGIDSYGYVYSSLYSETGSCIVSTGVGPNLYDWGLVSVDEDDYAFEGRQSLVAQFLALCYVEVLPEACKTEAFLALPRAEKITFKVGAHSGWESDELYVFEGERYEIDYGNVRLKRLNYKASCHTDPDTVERRFMDNLKTLDVQKCADELISTFEEVIFWLSKENKEPLNRIVIAWSSNFDREAAFGGVLGKTVLRWPGTFDFSKWFLNERPGDLDAEHLTSVRYSISCKIAEISCLASEVIVTSDVFKNLPKADGFLMRVQNRTAGQPLVFYPFT